MALMQLTEKQIDQIYAYRHILLLAQSLTGVPWIALAAIWYRERSLTLASNPFQFDPVPSAELRRHLYDKYSSADPLDIETYVFQGVNNFQAAAILAACFLKHKGATPESFCTAAGVKDAFWGYNGRAYGGADKSPYVMNNVDQWHKDMIIRGTIDGKPVRTVDKKLGAYGVWLQLRKNERRLEQDGSDCRTLPLQFLGSDAEDEQVDSPAPSEEKGERTERHNV